MRAANAKRNSILLLIAIILSLGIIRWHGVNNVSFCVYTAGCRFNETIDGRKIIGDVKVTDFGYPLVYRHVGHFRQPNDPSIKKLPNGEATSGFMETDLAQPSFSLPSVLINVIFWYALLHLLSSFIRPRAKAAQATEIPVEKS